MRVGNRAKRPRGAHKYAHSLIFVLLFLDILNWSIVCRSWVIDCGNKVYEHFDVRHGVKKWCQIWHRVILSLDYSIPCLASFFTSCLASKKSQFAHAINYPTLVNEALFRLMPYREYVPSRTFCIYLNKVLIIVSCFFNKGFLRVWISNTEYM